MKKIILTILFFISIIPFTAYGQVDLFQVKTPNVMIIFDTSSSMEMSVNIDTKGNSIWTTKYGPDKSTQYRQDGNHPDSKLYQAKNALSQIINEVVQDKVNMGFSTYAQEKIDTRRAQYTQNVSISEAWRRYKRYYLWGTTNDSTRTATSIYPDSFIDAWGLTRSSVTAGTTTFTRAIWIHNKSGPLHPQYVVVGQIALAILRQQVPIPLHIKSLLEVTTQRPTFILLLINRLPRLMIIIGRNISMIAGVRPNQAVEMTN